MRTSELAERAGVNTQTLRYYERRGLLDRPPRSTSGYRNYPASAEQLVRFVKRAHELGFSLDEAAKLVQLAAGGPRACASARALATARIGEIERRLADLQRMRDSLVELVATCDLPRRDRKCSLLQALQTSDAVAGDGR
ncbi:MerR family transcriptional regulator [Jatrophihabitans cynanchi]|uniref:MerR family transcriptional regulator n=1 Tax=Jatrophihabitans cynanchi TaxID=2944128 RepID=A0ABY7K559_9ACTN|nr:MerR family transcriptional regulator [Jatrophihabitans sp. SB3-54]WAX58411.1 MerR family transcriptional regulator [Jatrophihabitans sp. SB3-54]